MKIAIDGPAGSGKSTIAREISLSLKIPYLETGLVYRAVGYLVKKKLGSVDQLYWEDVEPLLSSVEVIPEVGRRRVLIDGAEISSEELRSEEAGRMASLIGTLGEFREYINDEFRRLVGKGQAVVEGRDAGTNIIPDADLKLFITASPEERAKRRLKQLKDRGEEGDYEEILKNILDRDRRDMERKDYPFKPAPDAVIVDTTGRSLEEVLREVFSLLNRVERG